MTQENAFLRAIIENPEDEVSRLVFADWLEENGDPDRAEFIRGQCRLARMQEWDEGFAELWIRCWRLLRTHRDRWSGQLAALARSGDWQAAPTFVRGFPEVITTSSARFVEEHERLFALAPVRGVHFLETWDNAVHSGFWRCAGLNRLREIWVYRPASQGAPPFSEDSFASPHLSITHLGVPSQLVRNLPDALATAPFAPQLIHLEIAGQQTNPSCWKVFCEAKSFANLRRFGFRTRYRLLDSISLQKLIAAPWFAGLDRLVLAGAEGFRSPAPLPGHPFLSQALSAAPLRGLALEGCALPQSEPAELQKLPLVPLEHLDLGSGSGINRKVLRTVLQCPALAGLRSFALSGPGSATLHHLTDSPLRNTIRVLRLSGCRPSSLLRLAHAGCDRLERLRIGICLRSHFREGDNELLLARAVDALLDPVNLPRLVSLGISADSSLALAVVQSLARNAGMVRLKELGLDLRVSHAEAKVLAGSSVLEGLARLKIWPHSLGEEKEEYQSNRATLLDRFGVRLDCERRTWPRHLSEPS